MARTDSGANSFQSNLFPEDALKKALQRIKEFEKPEGYIVAFSGGKDSVVVLDLAQRAGVKYEAVYNVTTIDPPELTRFIKKHYPDVSWKHHVRPFFQEAILRGYPSRVARWCCEVYKHSANVGTRTVITGVRWAESVNRRKHKMLHRCMKKGTTTLSPIIDWSDSMVWEYIKSNRIPYCSLYDEGHSRLGCILCPFVKGRKLRQEMARWPKFVKAWERFFEKLYAKRLKDTPDSNIVTRHNSGKECFEWWLTRKAHPGDPESKNEFQESIEFEGY